MRIKPCRKSVSQGRKRQGAATYQHEADDGRPKYDGHVNTGPLKTHCKLPADFSYGCVDPLALRSLIMLVNVIGTRQTTGVPSRSRSRRALLIQSVALLAVDATSRVSGDLPRILPSAARQPSLDGAQEEKLTSPPAITPRQKIAYGRSTYICFG